MKDREAPGGRRGGEEGGAERRKATGCGVGCGGERQVSCEEDTSVAAWCVIEGLGVRG